VKQIISEATNNSKKHVNDVKHLQADNDLSMIQKDIGPVNVANGDLLNDYGRFEEEAQILEAKKEYNACREKEKLRGSKEGEMVKQAEGEQTELDSNDPHRQQSPHIHMDVNQHWEIEKGFQNVGEVEVEEDIKNMSLTPSLRRGDKKTNVSAKHVTYEEDMVVGKTGEKVQDIGETSESVEALEKKAKRRKMIENAKRRKAEAEARIEAEKALEGARKRHQQQEGAQTLS